MINEQSHSKTQFAEQAHDSYTTNVLSKNHAFPVVGIGASAGGIEALESLFQYLPTNLGVSYVVVMHLDPNRESMLVNVLQRFTDMPVIQINKPVIVKPNHIYVNSPKNNIVLKGDNLTVIPHSNHSVANFPINYFFSSLADARRENALAIILSGAGSDGSAGIKHIKEMAGVVIAQEPTSAGFDSMPQSAINTNLVDHVLEPAQIAKQLGKWIKFMTIGSSKQDKDLHEVFRLLYDRTGHDFSSYKLNTIYRRIEKHMRMHQLTTLPEYTKLLQDVPEEVDALLKELLIGVTHFFRDNEVFILLKQLVIIPLLKEKNQQDVLRVWIAGCSTGEEAYSIAMLIQECMVELNIKVKVQIFATDIDESALEVGRSGIYAESIAQCIDPERLQTFFVKEKKFYKINKVIRGMITFGVQNVIRDPSFTKLDLICCRNLLIYLNADLQKKILPLFHYSLNKNGFLLLGKSESISGFDNLFQLLSKKRKIYKRKDAITNVHLLKLPTRKSANVNKSMDHHSQRTKSAKMKELIYNHLLNNCILPCVIIDKQDQIVYVHQQQQIASYFPGVSNLQKENIIDIAEPNIKQILTLAIYRVHKKQEEVVFKNINIHDLHLNLKFIPIASLNELKDFIMIVFEECTPSSTVHLAESDSDMPPTAQLQQKINDLEQELQHSNENLQLTIEELESNNEELQSTNEELQSTNEEIETSKEELQSLNEELVLVNSELQSRIDQLATVHEDMNNLFNRTEIAAVFLDNNLCIKWFTTKAQEYVRVINSDIGRPIRDFATNFKYDQLANDARNVINEAKSKTIEVGGTDGGWYKVHILPYRTLINVIDGVVVTFVDISQYKKVEQNLREQNAVLQLTCKYTEGFFNDQRGPTIMLNSNLKIMLANDSFCKLIQKSNEDILENFVYDVLDIEKKSTELKKLLEDVITEGKTIQNYIVKCNILNKSSVLNISAHKVLPSKTNIILVRIEEQK